MKPTQDSDRIVHWEKIYETKQPNELSWYEDEPTTSLNLIKELRLPKSARIMDYGAGDSFLVDHLEKLGFENITVQDISDTALNRVRERLGDKALKIKWIIGDEAQCHLEQQYDVWHDRAAFHFLTKEHEIQTYVDTIEKCIKPGGHFIIATFSVSGPKKCSGLDIKQYSEISMEQLLNKSFEKEKCFTKDHHTPSNAVQNFLYCSFRRLSA